MRKELATIIFLINQRGEVCLAQKKNPIRKKDGEELGKSKNTWNGYGGKKEKEDSILETAIIELQEESGVKAFKEDLKLVGRINFFWREGDDPIPDMKVWIFFLYTYEGNPKETEEMGPPTFFPPTLIPYEDMMPADKLFLPRLLSGEKIVADVFFQQDKSVRFKETNEPLELP
jgi:8-oxo-dGTP pyrophosphatase MutT (NUDIX family)